jgi:Phospholipase D-like domain at C-terminus of MIT
MAIGDTVMNPSWGRICRTPRKFLLKIRTYALLIGCSTLCASVKRCGVKHAAVKTIRLITSYENTAQQVEVGEKLGDLKQSLLEIDIILDIKWNEKLHDREIRINNGWIVKIGRGLDIYHKPANWYENGVNDLSL